MAWFNPAVFGVTRLWRQVFNLPGLQPASWETCRHSCYPVLNQARFAAIGGNENARIPNVFASFWMGFRRFREFLGEKGSVFRVGFRISRFLPCRTVANSPSASSNLPTRFIHDPDWLRYFRLSMCKRTPAHGNARNSNPMPAASASVPVRLGSGMYSMSGVRSPGRQ